MVAGTEASLGRPTPAEHPNREWGIEPATAHGGPVVAATASRTGLEPARPSAMADQQAVDERGARRDVASGTPLPESPSCWRNSSARLVRMNPPSATSARAALSARRWA